MKIYDQLVRGYFSGLIAGISIMFSAWFLYYFTDIYKTRFIDFNSVFILGHRPENWVETFCAWLASTIWLGGWGAITAYIFRFTSPKQYVLKGVFFGAFLWFCFHAGTSVMEYKTLGEPPVVTVLLNLVFSSVWGAATAYLIKWFEPYPNNS